MKTNELNGRNVSQNNSVEMTKEQQDAVCYKSKLLNKYFDSYADMVHAEEDYRKENAEKLKAKELLQNDVKEVNDFANQYLKLIADNNAIRNGLVKEEEEAYHRYKERLNKFAENHNGYRLVYKRDGDTVEFRVEETRHDIVAKTLADQQKLMLRFLEDFWF